MKTLITGAFNYSKEQIEILNSIGCQTVFVQDERTRYRGQRYRSSNL